MTTAGARDGDGLPIGAAGAVVTVGTFDGIHRGHADVLRHLVARADALGRPSVVVTFDPHPLQVLRPAAAPPLLTTRAEQLERFAESGVRYVAILRFTPALAALEAAAFVDQVLRPRYRVTELLVGHDHGFGRDRGGRAETLEAIGRARGIGVRVLPPVLGDGGAPISSTRLRSAIARGDVAEAAAGLGRAYGIAGRVVRGDGRGRRLGFPTLNVALADARKLLPADGVYAVRVQTPRGPFGGMLHVGGRPTFGDAGRRLEAHLFDARGDWYGAPVRLDLVARVRGVEAFPDATALRAQLGRDEELARRLLAAAP